MKNHVIRSAGENDWPALKRLLLEANLPVEDLDPRQLEQFLVAEDTAVTPPEIKGLIGLQQFGGTALLRSLVVETGNRGCGLGRQLVTALEDKARAAAVTDIWLLTNDAEVFFWKFGYRIADRIDAPAAIRATREFTSLCPDSAHLMHKQI